MKRLLLLRHAKSDWDDPAMRDFDRTLTERGNRAAARIGRLFKDERFDPAVIVSSPAVRTRQTVDSLERGMGRPLDVVWDERIYMAAADTLHDVVRGLDDRHASALVIGHNPGLEDLSMALIGSGDKDARAALAQKFPTAALADLSFAVDSWAQVARGSGRLTRFIRPRLLDPSLGED